MVTFVVKFKTLREIRKIQGTYKDRNGDLNNPKWHCWVSPRMGGMIGGAHICTLKSFHLESNGWIIHEDWIEDTFTIDILKGVKDECNIG